MNLLTKSELLPFELPEYADILPDAEKIATNKLVKNSVDKPISRRNLLSSLMEYIVREGVMRNSSNAAVMIVA